MVASVATKQNTSTAFALILTSAQSTEKSMSAPMIKGFLSGALRGLLLFISELIAYWMYLIGFGAIQEWMYPGSLKQPGFLGGLILGCIVAIGFELTINKRFKKT